VVFLCQSQCLMRTLGQNNSWQNSNLLYNQTITPLKHLLLVGVVILVRKIPVLITYSQNQSCGSRLELSWNHGPLLSSGLYQGWGRRKASSGCSSKRHKMGKMMKHSSSSRIRRSAGNPAGSLHDAGGQAEVY